MVHCKKMRYKTEQFYKIVEYSYKMVHSPKTALITKWYVTKWYSTKQYPTKWYTDTMVYYKAVHYSHNHPPTAEGGGG